MIKINLASRKWAFVSADGKKAKGADAGPAFLKGLPLDYLKDIPFRKILVPLVVGYAASLSLESYKEDALRKLEKAIGKQKAEEVRLQGGLSKVKSYEALKTSLLSDELVIRTKTETVQKLMKDRGLLVKMLLSTASATPAEVWLTAVKTDSTSAVI